MKPHSAGESLSTVIKVIRARAALASADWDEQRESIRLVLDRLAR